MDHINVRPFRYSDLDAIMRIAQASFAEEMIVQGVTPAAFEQQMRLMTRGRMIPFTVLSALSGITWEVLVAEVGGAVVGCAVYSGRQRMYLSTLMVAPEYRRRGVGQALLIRRLQRIKERGYPFASVTVLSTNQASLGNLRKQHFEVFEHTSVFEHALPLAHITDTATPKLVSRPLKRSDRPHFHAIEAAITNPVTQRVRDSVMTSYFRSAADRLFDRLAQTRVLSRCFERDGTVLGFVNVTSSRGQTKGMMARPIARAADLAAIPAMLDAASDWLAEIGREMIQITVPDDDVQLSSYLLDKGWTKCISWMHLVKWLEPN